MIERTRYELVDRYLQAVGKHLGHWRQREDVIKELGANILAQIEDGERKLGREMATPEVAAILKEHGSPGTVAARDRPQRAVIGPRWLPIYWRVLQIGLYWFVPVDVALHLALKASAPASLISIPSASPLAQVANAAMSGALAVFAWVTVIFVGVDWITGRRTSSAEPGWDPRQLPKLEQSWGWDRGRYAGLEMLPGIIAVGYWVLAVPRHPFFLFGMGAEYLRYSPALERLFWPVLGLLLVELGLDAVGMMYGENTWQRRAKGAGAKTVSLGIFALLLKTRGLIVAAAPAYERLARAVNSGYLTGVVFALWLVALTLVVDLARLGRMTAVAK